LHFAACIARDAGDGTMQMAAVTYHVVLAFVRGPNERNVLLLPISGHSRNVAD